MFYEERLIEGRWYSRSTPNGEWELMGVDKLAEKISVLRAQLAEAQRRIEELEKVEWILNRDGANECPWCLNRLCEGHTPDCARGGSDGMDQT